MIRALRCSCNLTTLLHEVCGRVRYYKQASTGTSSNEVYTAASLTDNDTVCLTEFVVVLLSFIYFIVLFEAMLSSTRVLP